MIIFETTTVVIEHLNNSVCVCVCVCVCARVRACVCVPS